MLTGKVSKMNLGSIEFDALLSSEPDSKGKAQFYIGTSQVAQLFQFDKNQASRDLKALLGASRQFDKMKSDLHPKAVNILTFAQFEVVIVKLTAKGNPIASELNLACLSMSLYQRACDSFGIHFEKEDRNAWLLDRAAGKIARNKLTDAIKQWLDTHEVSDTDRKFAYARTSDLLNLALTGRRASGWITELGIGKDELRDRFSTETLEEYKAIEAIAAKRIRKGVDPMQAVRDALDVSCTVTIDRPFG